MRFGTAILLTAATAWMLDVLLPWWSVALAAAFIAYVLPQKGGPSFLAGFLGIFVLWTLTAVQYNAANEGLIAARIGPLLGDLDPMLLILLGSVLGAFMGGMGAFTGFCARNISATS